MTPSLTRNIFWLQGDNNLCGLRVTEARAEDSGEWECEYQLPDKFEKVGHHHFWTHHYETLSDVTAQYHASISYSYGDFARWYFFLFFQVGDKAKKKFQVVVELPWNTTWEGCC